MSIYVIAYKFFNCVVNTKTILPQMFLIKFYLYFVKYIAYFYAKIITFVTNTFDFITKQFSVINEYMYHFKK